MRTEELCRIAVEDNGNVLMDVPEESRTKELCRLAIENSNQECIILRDVPEELRTKELCRFAVEKDGRSLEYVPEKFKTADLCHAAVEEYGFALEYVPVQLRTEEICRLAVSQDINALRYYIPEQSRTIDLYEFALKKDAKSLRYVPRHMRWDVLRELSDDVPLMVELIKDMKFRGHDIAPSWFRNGNISESGSAEDQDAAVSIDGMLKYYESESQVLGMNGSNTFFALSVSKPNSQSCASAC